MDELKALAKNVRLKRWVFQNLFHLAHELRLREIIEKK